MFVAIVPVAALVAPVATAPARDAGEIRITESGFSDADVSAETGETRFIWADESTTPGVALETSGRGGEGHYGVCVRSEPTDDRYPTDLECRSEALTGNSTEELAFSFDGWLEAYRGEQTVSIIVTADTLGRDEAARATHAVSVIERTADADGDGASNRREVDGGTDFADTDVDTDADGLSDASEVDVIQRIPPFALFLDIPFVGAALGSALWATRRRWLPYVPRPVRAEVVESGASARTTGIVVAVGDWTDRVRSWVAAVVGDETTAANGDRDRSDPGPDDGPSEVPLEMLSNEDAVLAVLRRNGGRVRQSALVEETGWSKSKASRVLSRMDDAGRVTKINVGRGNVITLPGEEPDGADSPFSK